MGIRCLDRLRCGLVDQSRVAVIFDRMSGCEGGLKGCEDLVRAISISRRRTNVRKSNSR